MVQSQKLKVLLYASWHSWTSGYQPDFMVSSDLQTGSSF